MYYDTDGPLRTGGAPPPPFRVDFVCGGDANAGCVSGAEPLPLSQLYFCDSCSRLVSRRDLAEDVDSYYCPHCLENMPSSEAMLYGMRCSKCWECPVCASTLTMCSANPSAQEQSYHLACGCCRWSSKGRLEALQPEQLVAKIIALERDSDPRKCMAALVDAFRTRAQEQQRERELAQRLRRRSSIARGSFTGASLNAFAARRFSSALILRQARAASPSLLDGADQVGGAGPWRIDDLEAKLRDQTARSTDLRADARTAAASAASRPPPAGGLPGDPPSPGGVPGAPNPLDALKGDLSKLPGGAAAAAVPVPPVSVAPEVPVLEGLTVEELIRSHTQLEEQLGPPPILDRLRESLEEAQSPINGHASLAQRLQQVSYGYQGASVRSKGPEAPMAALPTTGSVASQPGKGKKSVLRTGFAQLEAPLHHSDTWALLPVRKPLLTKRSRRCRLLTMKPDKDDKTAAPSSKPCRAIIVKPHINPCSNPPFQKNNVALAFVPRCAPWAWRSDSGAGEGGLPRMAAAVMGDPGPRPGLKEGEGAELIFAMANPLDADVEVTLDPTYFNPGGPGSAAVAGSSLSYLTKEQNVQVLTKPFTTTIAKFNDLADVSEAFTEDTAKLTALRAKDDIDVVADRKMHKVLVRLRFRALERGRGTDVWAFYVQMSFSFQDTAGTTHQVKTVLRFGSVPCKLVAPPPAVAEEEAAAAAAAAAAAPATTTGAAKPP